MKKEYFYNQLQELGIISDEDIRKFIIDWRTLVEGQTGLTCPNLSKVMEKENPTLPDLWNAQDQDIEYFKLLVKKIKEFAL